MTNLLYPNQMPIPESELIAKYPIGIYHLDIDGHCVYLNNYAKQLLGMNQHEALGDGWQRAIHPDDLPKIMKQFAGMQQNKEPITIEYRIVNQLVGVKWVHSKITGWYENNKLIGYIGIVLDITSLRENEKQLQQRLHQFEHLTRLSTLGEISASIAHQLNQPLTAIVHYTGGILARMDNINDNNRAMRKAIEKIAYQAERAGNIIHEMREFLHFGAVQQEALNINETVLDVIDLISNIIEATDLQIKLMLDENLPLIDADKIQIEQVIINIISNAVEAMQTSNKKKLRIVIKTERPNDNVIKIHISNNGPVVDDKIVKQLFEPFFTTKQQGMGLGLTIATSIMQSHGGFIEVTHQNQHPTFSLTLPIKGNANDCAVIKKSTTS